MKIGITSGPVLAEKPHSAAGAQRKAASGTLDARASTLAQLRHQDLASSSNQALQLKARANMMAGGGANALVQRVDEEDLLQGKFSIAQRAEDEELLQGKFEPVQRMEDDELLQGRFVAQAAAQMDERPNNTGMPNQLKSGVESLSGMSMNHVMVHYNSHKPAQLNAHAYAQGSDIFVAPGQEQHLPHEAWHVVQQMQGRVQPTTMVGDVQVNDNTALESEATSMGNRALQRQLDDKPVQCVREMKLVDNRPETKQMQTLQLMADAGSGARQQRAFPPADGVAQLFPGVIHSAFERDLDAGLRDQQGSYLRSDSIVHPSTIATDDASGIYQYVITEDDELIIGQRSRENRWAHPNLIGGIDPRVGAAGELKFSHSILFALNTKSGHFQPPSSTLALATEVLSNTFNSTDELQTGNQDFDLNTLRNPRDIHSFNAFGRWQPSSALLDRLSTGSNPSAPIVPRGWLEEVFNNPLYRNYNPGPLDLSGGEAILGGPSLGEAQVQPGGPGSNADDAHMEGS